MRTCVGEAGMGGCVYVAVRGVMFLPTRAGRWS